MLHVANSFSLGLPLPKERKSYNSTTIASRLRLDGRVTSKNDFFLQSWGLRALVWRSCVTPVQLAKVTRWTVTGV